MRATADLESHHIWVGPGASTPRSRRSWRSQSASLSHREWACVEPHDCHSYRHQCAPRNPSSVVRQSSLASSAFGASSPPSNGLVRSAQHSPRSRREGEACFRPCVFNKFSHFWQGAATQGGVAAQTRHRDGAARPMPGNAATSDSAPTRDPTSRGGGRRRREMREGPRGRATPR